MSGWGRRGRSDSGFVAGSSERHFFGNTYRYIIFTARKRSLRRLCFHRCLSTGGGGGLPLVLRGCLPHPPWADTPLGRRPHVDTFPCPVHTGIHPPPSACWDAVNKRAIRIPLEWILVFNNFNIDLNMSCIYFSTCFYS